MNRLSIASSTGLFVLEEKPDGTLRGWWQDDETEPLPDRPSPRLRELADPLTRALEGFGEAFSDIDTPRGTPFQERCWQALRGVPAGETVTYGALAQLAGSGPGGSRAVGGAMRRNPLPIIIPCHRVIAADGPGGFCGCDDPNDPRLKRKFRLLALEAEHRSDRYPRRTGIRPAPLMTP